jgi:16S rRNA (guanine527-N7)-methyltransferase
MKINSIDSTLKKIVFVEETASKMGLKNLKALHGRGVEMGRQRQWRGRFKFMTARAVGALPKLLSETESLLGKEGVLAVFRTPKQCQEEMDALKLPSSDMAKWKIMATEYFDLPEDAGTRNFILCRRS